MPEYDWNLEENESEGQRKRHQQAAAQDKIFTADLDKARRNR